MGGVFLWILTCFIAWQYCLFFENRSVHAEVEGDVPNNIRHHRQRIIVRLNNVLSGCIYKGYFPWGYK